MLENRIQTIIDLPADQALTEAQRNDLDLTKQALAVVSGLQDGSADAVASRLRKICAGVITGHSDPAALDSGGRGVSAEQVFVNRKVLDLVTKAEMEREDYRRKTGPNVFFGTLKTLWHRQSTDKEGNTVDEPVRFSTLWINFWVMMASLIAIVNVLQILLKRQLSKV
jgi:hypothetical protein